MNSRLLELNSKVKAAIVMLEKALLVVYILLSPIYMCFSEFTIGGLSVITIIVGLLLICYAANLLSVIKSKQHRFLSLLILIIFCLELPMATRPNEIGWIIPVLLYVGFLQTDKAVYLGVLFRAVLYSAILAGIFSLSLGLAGGVVTRVATVVDGSIAPIAISIVLFYDEGYRKKGIIIRDSLRVAAVISSFVVLIFGMSRARFLVIGLCFAIFAVSRIRNIVKSGGRASRKAVWYFFIPTAIITFMLIFGGFWKIFKPIIDRFLFEGFDSMGRDVESGFGWYMFRNNVFLGGGWGDFLLQDYNGSIVPYSNHNAYLAILARGGLAFAVPVFLSYCLLVSGSLKIWRSRKVALVLMLVFLLLSYGNAGMFNYTICSIIPMVVLDVKKGVK